MYICNYCNASPHGNTQNIATQIFNDKSVSNIKLNCFNSQLLTADTWNVPNTGVKMYTVVGKINYCPMCGRDLATKTETE